MLEDERLQELKVEARSSATPVGRLLELAGQDPVLARVVAMRIGLPGDLAEELAETAEARGDTATLRALAAHPVTTPERLAVLAGHADAEVRRAVALHRATPKAVLRGLVHDPEPAVRQALAARERLPKSIAEVLLTDDCADVRLTLARRPDARPKHLRVLADDPNPRVRRFVTWLGYGSAASLDDPDPGVRRMAVDRCGVEELAPHLDRFVRDPEARIRALVADMSRNRTPASLAVLAADPDPAVRRTAAANWFMPEAALVALAADTEPTVLRAVCENPFASPQALAKIVEAVPVEESYYGPQVAGDDASPWRDIFYALCHHPRTSPESLRTLRAMDPYKFENYHPIYLANCPPDLLIEYAMRGYIGSRDDEETYESYREIDQAREKLDPPQVLAMMARSPLHDLRMGAATNRHTPPEALAEYVRAADPEQELYTLEHVAANPATPVEVLLAWASAGVHHSDMLKNPDLPEPVLRVIAADGDHYDADKARLMLAVRAAQAGTEAEC